MTDDLKGRVEKLEKLLAIGKENRFILAWGRLFAAQKQLRLMFLVMAVVLMVSVVGNIVLAVRVQKRETWVFVKDHLGNVIQADPNTFLRAGEKRDEMELKGFALRWVRDAYTFTPLDVKDRVTLALRQVEPKAHGYARAEMRLAERAQMIEKGVSVRIEDNPDQGKVPQVHILRMDPIEVQVVFSRQSVGADGATLPISPLAVVLRLKYVPRSPTNPNGLLVTAITSTQSS